MKRYIKSSSDDYNKMMQANMPPTPLTEEQRAQGYESAFIQYDTPLNFSEKYLEDYKKYLVEELYNYNLEVLRHHFDPIDVSDFYVKYDFTFRQLLIECHDNKYYFDSAAKFSELLGLRELTDIPNLKNAVKQDAKFIYEEIAHKYGGQIKHDLYGD